MIKMCAIEATRQSKPLTLCGEIASNPLFIPLLLGLGIKRFSCAPRFIPLFKRTVRQYSLVQSYQIAEEVLRLKTSSEITQYLLSVLHTHLKED